jgi:alkane 1-monooxygenase
LGGAPATLLSVAILLLSLIGAELVSHRSEPRGAERDDRRLLPIVYVPLQVAAIVWGMSVVAKPDTTPFDGICLALALGVMIGVFGMLCAHELAHSANRAHRAVALVMLTAMSYRQFRISHLYGHHRFAGTERDSATAKLGESFYRFLIRTVIWQWCEAWRFEARRLTLQRKGFRVNRSLGDAAAMLFWYALVFWAFGWRGAAFFLGESLVGIIVLELFNYIAHYGLTRDAAGDGRLAPFGDQHSWNSSNALANRLIFNMGRHSDHHRRPYAAYAELAYLSHAPELPAGYAGSILLALVPPLWRLVMDKRVLALRQSPTEPARLAA